MKILTFVFGTGIGGTERAAQNFAITYSNLGHDSRLLSFDTNGVRAVDLRELGKIIYGFDISDLEKIQKWDPDIVHIHSHLIHLNEFKKLKKYLNNPVFVETNVFSDPSPWEEYLDKSFQLSEWCNSCYVLRGGNPHKSCVVPYPVDISRFERANSNTINDFRLQHFFNENDVVIGRIGQPSEAKWSPLIIKLFNQLACKRPNLKLYLVGAPESILALAKKSDFRDQIFCEDILIGDDTLATAYSSIDIFLHISHIGESFGMVLAESLLCETPVVSLQTPWYDNSQAEVIGDGIGGYVASSPQGLFHLCLRLIDTKELRTNLGVQGRQYILSRFDSWSVSQSALQAALDIKTTSSSQNRSQFIPLSNLITQSNFATRILVDIFPLRKYTHFTVGYLSLREALVRKFNTLISVPLRSFLKKIF